MQDKFIVVFVYSLCVQQCRVIERKTSENNLSISFCNCLL